MFGRVFGLILQQIGEEASEQVLRVAREQQAEIDEEDRPATRYGPPVGRVQVCLTALQPQLIHILSVHASFSLENPGAPKTTSLIDTVIMGWQAARAGLRAHQQEHDSDSDESDDLGGYSDGEDRWIEEEVGAEDEAALAKFMAPEAGHQQQRTLSDIIMARIKEKQESGAVPPLPECVLGNSVLTLSSSTGCLSPDLSTKKSGMDRASRMCLARCGFE